MRVRPNVLVLLAVVGVASTTIGVTPAAAKGPRIAGSVRCTMSNASMTFSPGLRYREHIEGVQKGRGPSATSFTADLSGCTDPSAGPAPAGIDHGVLTGTGKVRQSYCERLDGLKLVTTINWMQADDTVVGKTVVKLGVNLATPGFDPPWTLTFQNAAKAGSTVFGREWVKFLLDTTTPNWANSGQCFKVSLDALEFANGTLAVDPTA